MSTPTTKMVVAMEVGDGNFYARYKKIGNNPPELGEYLGALTEKKVDTAEQDAYYLKFEKSENSMPKKAEDYFYVVEKKEGGRKRKTRRNKKSKKSRKHRKKTNRRR